MGAPKPDVVERHIGFRFSAIIKSVAFARADSAPPRAAAKHTFDALTWALRIAGDLALLYRRVREIGIRGRAVPIGCPLPNVAYHIEEAMFERDLVRGGERIGNT